MRPGKHDNRFYLLDMVCLSITGEKSKHKHSQKESEKLIELIVGSACLSPYCESRAGMQSYVKVRERVTPILSKK